MSWSISCVLLVLTTGLCLSPQLLRKTHPLTKFAMAYGVYQLLRLDQASHQVCDDLMEELDDTTEPHDIIEGVDEQHVARQTTPEVHNTVTQLPDCICEVCHILKAPFLASKWSQYGITRCSHGLEE